MRLRRLLGRLPAHLARREGARGLQREGLRLEAAAARGKVAIERRLDRGADMALLGDRVDEADRLRLPRRDRSAGQHHGHGLDRIGNGGRAIGAAEPRMKAQHHFRKAEAGIGDGDPPVAGERDLEPRAEAVAVDDRDGLRLERRQPVEHMVGLFEHAVDLGRRGADELLDVGADREARRLGGADDQRGRLLLGDRVQMPVQFLDDAAVDRVDRAVRPVEHQPGDIVPIGGEAPVALLRRIAGRAQFEGAIGKRGQHSAHGISVSSLGWKNGWKNSPGGISFRQPGARAALGAGTRVRRLRAASPRPARRRCIRWRCRASARGGAWHWRDAA